MTIQMEKVCKRFPQPGGMELSVLEDVDLAIAEGEFVIILGESGCGKSTLLNLMAGLLPLSEGEIRVNGRRVAHPHPSRAMLFQQPSLLPWLDVEQNIVFGCRLRGEKDDLRVRTAQLIEIMGLAGFEKVKPHELSLGMAQRVCLARAMIGHPQILLLDEPFASLDTITRSHLQEELIEFWMVEKFTAVFVTHDIDEAILMGTKVVLLGGRPCGILQTYEVNLNFPRDIASRGFFLLRSAILKKLRESFDGHERG